MLLGGLIVVSIALSYALNKIFIRFSERLNALNQANTSGQIRWASHSKPLVGGITFFLVFLFAALFYYASPWFAGEASDNGMLALLTIGSIGFLVGLADDAYTTQPFLKFLGQFACGVAMIVFGASIDLFGTPWLDYPLTLLWVVGIMNSINMLDNMDGVTGSVSLGILFISSCIMLVTGAELGAVQVSAMVLIGTLVGFLYLNWNPSKLFMGDTGSQFLGAVLAFYGIQFFWNLPQGEGEWVFVQKIFMPVLAFLMPILDTSFVTVARLRRGQSPFMGGKDHTTHHLSYLGLSQKLIPVVTLSVTLLSGGLVLATVVFIETWSAVSMALNLLYVVLIFGLFYFLYQRGNYINKLKSLKAKRKELHQARLAAQEHKELVSATLSEN